jgi:hypothetical protein
MNSLYNFNLYKKGKVHIYRFHSVDVIYRVDYIDDNIQDGGRHMS